MAQMTFSYAPMGGGKSLAALIRNHQASEHGRPGLLLVMSPREDGIVASRVGVSAPATVITEADDLHALTCAALQAGPVWHVVADEAQFYTAAQIEQLARVADELDVPVHAYGLLTDFRARLFPGSARLLELADVSAALPSAPSCPCGAAATHNARVVGGRVVTEGAQKLVGDTSGEAVRYVACCRSCLRAGRFAEPGECPAVRRAS